MNLDITDFHIIKLTMQQKSLTSTRMAQIIFSPKDVYELRRKDALIRERAKKLLAYGILERKMINDVSYWDVGKSVFSDIPIHVDKQRVKFLGIVIRSGDSYIIHGISK